MDWNSGQRFLFYLHLFIHHLGITDNLLSFTVSYLKLFSVVCYWCVNNWKFYQNLHIKIFFWDMPLLLWPFRYTCSTTSHTFQWLSSHIHEFLRVQKWTLVFHHHSSSVLSLSEVTLSLLFIYFILFTYFFPWL